MNISIPGLHIICGLQGQGKSHLIRFIMYNYRKKFDCGLVFTGTEFGEGNFDYIDERFVHRKYNETALENMMDIFRKRVKAGKPLCGFVIFDDCISGKQWHSDALIDLCTQVRHYNITVILSTQYPVAIPPTLRANAFQVFMFTMTLLSAIKALYESFGQMFGTFEEFKATFLDTTSKKYRCLEFDARNGGTTPESRYKMATVQEGIPKFHVGPKAKE